MNKKRYNSISARVLAKKYKLKISQIKSHRKDNKITVNDVKTKIKKKSKMETPILFRVWFKTNDFRHHKIIKKN